MSYTIDYDIAVGVSQAALDRTSAELYRANPSLFSGVEKTEEYTIYWEAVGPPVFDLSQPRPKTVAALADPSARAELEAEPDGEIIGRSLTTASNNFAISSPNMAVRLQLGDGPIGETLNLPVTAECTVETVPETRKIVFNVETITVGLTGDPFTDEIFQKYLVPALKDQINSVLQGVKVEIPDITGGSLSPPIVVILDKYIVGAMFLESGGGGSPSTLINIPSGGTDFFALMSQRCVEASADYGIEGASKKVLSGDGKKSSKGFFATYSYKANLGDPDVDMRGRSINATIPVSGKASAKVGKKINLGFTKQTISIGISYSIYAKPNPSGRFSLNVTGGVLSVRIETLEPFTILLKPSGNPVNWALSAAVGLVVQPIVAVLTPAVTTTIRNIAFDVWTLPEYTVDAGDMTMVCEMVDARFYEYSTDLCMQGTIAISFEEQGEAAEDEERPSTQRMLAEAGPVAPCALDKCLYQSIAVGQKLTGGLYFAGVYQEMGQGAITEYTTNSLAAEGVFDFDVVLMNQRIQGTGTFSARVWYDEGALWNVHLLVGGSWNFDYTGKLGCAYLDGACVFQGTIDLGYPVEIRAKIMPSSGAGRLPSYVRVYSEVISPDPELLPTAYAKYTPQAAVAPDETTEDVPGAGAIRKEFS
ncbi:MAG: hypothetical protein DMF64_21905 [Acidobacteria bacterium]|nr:MAG: hypothetical protein DMF64_21905 [Acidobacteriota bacterium]